MGRKTDIRGYINPFVPGGKTEQGQRANMPEGAEIYVETRTGEVIDKFIRSLRDGSIAAVEELHYLAPGRGGPKKRRKLMGERVKAICRKATIRENYRGLNSGCDLPAMLLHGSDQIATSGRARGRKVKGAPVVWPRPPATIRDYERHWFSRKYGNDKARRLGILDEFGAAPSVGTLRRLLGSPHKE